MVEKRAGKTILGATRDTLEAFFVPPIPADVSDVVLPELELQNVHRTIEPDGPIEKVAYANSGPDARESFLGGYVLLSASMDYEPPQRIHPDIQLADD